MTEEAREGRKILAKTVRALRTAHEMTQEDLAGAAEIDRSYVSMIETEKFSASIDMIEKLAKAFRVEIFEMIHPQTLSKADQSDKI